MITPDLFQMPRWNRRLPIVLDWTVALFFRPDITRVDLASGAQMLKSEWSFAGLLSLVPYGDSNEFFTSH